MRTAANAADWNLTGSPSYEDDQRCLENKAGGEGSPVNPELIDKLTPEKVRDLASEDVALYLDAVQDWNDALPFILRELGINISAWLDACEGMGEAIAFLTLIIVDRNRYHPVTPVLNPGGALRACTRKAPTGDLNLTRAILGIWERERQGRQPKGPDKTVRAT